MSNKEKGITLIALIITIIVMLILVGVVVTVVIQSNLLGTAKTAVDKYKIAYEDESNMSEVTINGEKYASIDDYIESTKPLPEIKAGERASEKSKYQTAVIPKGFTVSNATGEKDVSTGLVIYDIPENELENVKWDGTEKTKYNQFVWIPVEVNKETDTETEIASFYRSKWSNNARITGLEPYYNEPIAMDNEAGITSQIEKLIKSIYKYSGFYIGRYEAGSKTERTSSSGVTPIGIKQDMYPYNYVKWGESMSEIGTEGAVYLSNNLYNSSDYGATSMLCTGACWDSMLDFIKDEEHNVSNSASWGNYSDAEFEITRGRYAESVRGTLGSFTAVVGTYNKELESVSNKNILLTTGASERNSAKNIYDVAGNCFEWTTESSYNRARVMRGGDFSNDGSYSSYPANFRYGYGPTDDSLLFGFRPILYVNI